MNKQLLLDSNIVTRDGVVHVQPIDTPPVITKRGHLTLVHSVRHPEMRTIRPRPLLSIVK